MKILVARPLHPRWVNAGLGDTVLYRPELEGLSASRLAEVLREHPVDAVIAHGSPPETKESREHRRGDHNAPHWISCGIDEGIAGTRAESGAEADLRVLGLAERTIQERTVRWRLEGLGMGPSMAASPSLDGARVSLVGAGIVNLVNALELVEQGAHFHPMQVLYDPQRDLPTRSNVMPTVDPGDQAVEGNQAWLQLAGR